VQACLVQARLVQLNQSPGHFLGALYFSDCAGPSAF
jgi:hypothetical protein